jgi:hypothetical protein
MSNYDKIVDEKDENDINNLSLDSSKNYMFYFNIIKYSLIM